MLELRNIQKSYHSRVVLQPASLQLDKGIYWVKGANGSGKTTLLKMIAGLIPFEGDIMVDGTSQLNNPVQYRQKVSWAEAEPLYPGFVSGADLVSLYTNIRKAHEREVNEIVDLLNMSTYIDNPVRTYSAGMAKKLSLLLAFIGDVPLCVLDEPLITLDAASLDLVSEYIVKRHQQQGTTFLLSSHQELNTQIIFSGNEILIADQRIIVNEEGR